MERVECLQKSFFSDMNDEVMMREIHRNVGNPGFAKKGGGSFQHHEFFGGSDKVFKQQVIRAQ